MVKRCCFIILVLCILTPLTGCKDNDIKLNLADAEALIETIELTHPAFSLNEVSNRYEEAKKNFIAEAANEMTYTEFIWCIKKYVASLNDGHSQVQNNHVSLMFIDISWQAVGDKLFLLDQNGMITNKQIITIGGVSISDIFNIADLYHPMENEVAKERNRTLWSRSKDVLLIADSDIRNNRVTVLIEDGEEAFEATYKFKRKNIYDFYKYFSVVTSKRIGDVFYIDYNACELGRQLSNTVSKIERALSDGITSFIIDVRNNPGGNSEANKALLETLGMAEPQSGIYLRYSPLLSKQWGREEVSGYVEYPADITVAQKNTDINLAVLTNENTYSSAMLLAVGVQDGSLGTIIGQPSSNAPSNYGDVLSYTLPDSKIKVGISCKRFLRPDINADPDTLIPDIITEYNGDALAIALEFLSKN